MNQCSSNHVECRFWIGNHKVLLLVSVFFVFNEAVMSLIRRPATHQVLRLHAGQCCAVCCVLDNGSADAEEH